MRATQFSAVGRFDGRRWRTYTARDGLPEGVGFVSLYQTGEGTIWATGNNGRLCRLEGDRWKVYPPEQVPQFSGILASLTAPGRPIWFWEWGQDKAYRFDSAAQTRWTVYPELKPDQIYSIGDEVWLARSDGAVRYDGKTWTKYTAADGLIDGHVWTILRAKDGSLWVAGQHQGKSAAAHYDGSKWRIFSTVDGLVGDNIVTGYVASNGDLWFGTGLGLVRVRYGLMAGSGMSIRLKKV